MGLEVKTTEQFKRQAPWKAWGRPTIFDDAFTTAVGTVLGPIPMPEATVVVKVVQHADADMSKLPEQRDQHPRRSSRETRRGNATPYSKPA